MANRYFLTCWGGVGDVTGANFMLENDDGGFKILIDCGLVQGSEDAEERNRKPFSYDPSEVSSLFVTHAHADHIGRIPLLVRAGFNGDIYSTPATARLAAVMFTDMVKIY